MHHERAEFEQSAGHAFGGGDAVQTVQTVSEFGDVQQHSVVLKACVERPVVYFGQVVVGDGLVHLPLCDQLLGSDLRAGYGKCGVTYRIARFAFQMLKYG